MTSRITYLATGLLGLALSFNALAVEPVHGLAMHGDLKYPPGFTHFDYSNPNAPKGGKVNLSALGSFDSLNPFILKGRDANSLGLVFDTLTTSSDDEAFSQYGLLASSMEVPQDRSWVIFNLRPEARFHDGSPITTEDVAFSLEILKTKGHPFYRSYFGNVGEPEILGPHRIKLSFEGGENREMPLIIGQLPILSKAWWSTREFDKTTLEFPLGSGPYRVKTVDPGRSITYERVEDYWARDLPVNKGRYNFDQIRIDYYRDSTIALEAFKAGEFDFRQENVAKNWATAYDIATVKNGQIIKEAIAHEQGTGMQAFVINTRRDMFKDLRVREALGLLFDFEWTNKNLFYDAYTRSNSYFSNTELASSGLPQGEELAILERYRDQLPPELFTKPFTLPATRGDGNIRPNLRQALRLFKQAGWQLKNKRLVDQNNAPMAFEILLVQPTFERIVLPFKNNLEKLGIEVSVRTVDTSQYKNRLDQFDFDMAVGNFGQSLSPGNEQRDFWSSAVADEPGSRNLMGIRNPVVDELIELVISAPDRDSLVARTRALDRVLLWQHYLIPNWHITKHRIVYWNKFAHPEITPRYALGFYTWWVDADKAAKLKKP
ncbi:MAG: extracellular solute-binding protein [Gammaproteobacteria bacterium]|nr:extracellular solute-binding protein [Gammaproteobacteria bacterium]